MAFRVPVLEHFMWQPSVLRIDVKSIDGIAAIKGDRYIISNFVTGTEAFDATLKKYPNCIMYHDGDSWEFDKPKDGWTTVFPTVHYEVDSDTGDIKLDENGQPISKTYFQLIYFDANFKETFPDPENPNSTITVTGKWVPWEAKLFEVDGSDFNVQIPPKKIAYVVEEMLPVHEDPNDPTSEIVGYTPKYQLDEDGNKIPLLDEAGNPVEQNWDLQSLLNWMDKNVGGPGPLGKCADGCYKDGLLPWTNETRVNNALDNVNTALLDLAPEKPSRLDKANEKAVEAGGVDNHGIRLYNGGTSTLTTRYTGKLAVIPDIDEQQHWYVAGLNPGDLLTAGAYSDGFITTKSVTFKLVDEVNGFSFGDKGSLELYHMVGAQRAAYDITSTEATKRKFKEAIYDIFDNYCEPGIVDPEAKCTVRPELQNLSWWDDSTLDGRRNPGTSQVVTAKSLTENTLGKATLGHSTQGLPANEVAEAPGSFSNIQFKDNQDSSGTDATLTITKVEWYNKFRLWQKMNAKVDYTNLRPGYHYFQWNHIQEDGTDDLSNSIQFWYDPTPDNVVITAPVPGDVTVVNPTANDITFYLSGLKYYTNGTIVNTKGTVSNLFSHFYNENFAQLKIAQHTTNTLTLNSINVPEIVDDSNGFANVPTFDEDLNVNHNITLGNGTGTSQVTTNLKVTLTTSHPFKTARTETYEASPPILFSPYKNGTSTDLIEDFNTEKYRLRNEAIDGKAAFNFTNTAVTYNDLRNNGEIGSNWFVEDNLSNTHEAVIFVNGTKHCLQAGIPELTGSNNAADYQPAQPDTINYAGKTQGQTFCRAFIGTKAASKAVITIEGSNVAPNSKLKALGTTNTGYNLEVKLPGRTAWLDAGKLFNQSTFNKDIAGHGVQTSINGTSVTITFHVNNIVDTSPQYVMYVRLTINDAACKFTKMSVNFN